MNIQLWSVSLSSHHKKGHHVHRCPTCYRAVPCEDMCSIEHDLRLDDGTDAGAYAQCDGCVREGLLVRVLSQMALQGQMEAEGYQVRVGPQGWGLFRVYRGTQVSLGEPPRALPDAPLSSVLALQAARALVESVPAERLRAVLDQIETSPRD